MGLPALNGLLLQGSQLAWGESHSAIVTRAGMCLQVLTPEQNERAAENEYNFDCPGDPPPPAWLPYMT